MSDWSGLAIPKPVKRAKVSKRRKPGGQRPDRVDDSLRVSVLERDGMCFVRRLYVNHVCFDKWGKQHAAHERDKLTLDHVWLDGARRGDRAPSDMEHLVALCHFENVKGVSREVRAAQRKYLMHLYPTAHD